MSEDTRIIFFGVGTIVVGIAGIIIFVVFFTGAC